MATITVSNGGTSLKAALAAVQNGDEIVIGTAANQVVTNVGSTSLTDRPKAPGVRQNVTLRGFGDKDNRCTIRNPNHGVVFNMSGMRDFLCKDLIIDSEYNGNDGTATATGNRNGMVQAFAGDDPVRDIRFEYVQFNQNTNHASAVHGNGNIQNAQFYRCDWRFSTFGAPGRIYAGETCNTGAAAISMINHQDFDGTGVCDVTFRECTFRDHGGGVNSTGIGRDHITDGHFIQIDDQQSSGNPSSPIPGLIRYWIIDCDFDHCGGSAINHNSIYGGQTYIINCSGQNLGRTNLLTETQYQAGQVQNDRGFLTAFSTATGNPHLITMVNNVAAGRNTGSERMVFYSSASYSVVGHNNVRYNYPSAGAPAPGGSFYFANQDPGWVDYQIGNDTGDMTPTAGSILLGNGVASSVNVPATAGDGLPTFNTASLPHDRVWLGGDYPGIGAIARAGGVPTETITQTSAVSAAATVYAPSIGQNRITQSSRITAAATVYAPTIGIFDGSQLVPNLSVKVLNGDRGVQVL